MRHPLPATQNASVEPFGLLDWPGVLDLLTARATGRRSSSDGVRAAERADLDGTEQP